MKEILIAIAVTGIIATIYPHIVRLLDIGIQILENKATLSATKTQVKINELLPEEVQDCQPIGYMYDGADVEYLDYEEDDDYDNKCTNKSKSRIGY